MSSYLLPREQLNTFLAALKDCQLWLPVRREGRCIFEPVADPATTSPDLEQQPVTAKRAVFPQTELLFTFDTKAGVQEDFLQGLPETLLFGIRPCDARAFTLLDPVFESPLPDPYYLSRRSRAVMIGIACVKPFPNCFCTSIGGDPFGRAGLDLLFTEGDNAFFIEVITERGKTLLHEAASLLMPAEEKDLERNRQQCLDARTLITRHPDTGCIPEKLSSLFEHRLWKQYADRCIGCGICTYSCPTCYCFDMQDEAVATRGRRVRTWDSCMFPEYTLHASGHNPRPTRTERFRNRIYHKFKFNQDNFGALSCVGCGRCISLCPVNIDLIECLAAIKETP